MLKWLEISGDFRCNNRCLGCFSVLDDGAEMSATEAIETLRAGRAGGAEWLWLGGGEPTLRRDLFAIVRTARRLGYTRVKLQTNGMRLAYPEYTKACAEAGVTEVNFALKGAAAESHDRLTRTPGCFDLLVKGIENWRRLGRPMDGDVLVYRSSMHELPEIVRGFFERGLERFNVWLFSATDHSPRDLSAEVPRIVDVMPHIARALDLGLSPRSDFITSLHTPPCTVPESHASCRFHAADLDLLVANPGGYRFRLERSPIEGGCYLERCGECALRSRCGGIRADYLAIHGDQEFQPVRDPSRRPLPALRDVVGLERSAPPAKG